MQNPFSTDYDKSQVTQAVPAAAPAQKVTVTVATGQVPSESVEGADPKAYGFEPQRYGLGKPRRLVVRGKIAIE